MATKNVARKNIVKVLLNDKEVRALDERRAVALGDGSAMSRSGFLRWTGLSAELPVSARKTKRSA